MLRVSAAVVLLCLMSTCTSEIDFSETDYNTAVSTRDQRFFPFFSVVRIRRTPCTGGNNLRGTCYTRRECSSHGGSPSGTCANGWGVCCILQKTCGGSTNINCTYFSNTGYPATNSTGGRCTFTVNKCNSNVCQLRVDFLDFSLAQPDSQGNCINDFLSIMGGASSVPNICGENTNQHVYVDFAAGNSPIQLTVNVNGAVAEGRKWNLKVTQIECTSPQRAPTGCLMYYTDTVGKVMSFNYATAQRNLDTYWTRELANLNYGVCVQMVPGYCSIEWSQNPNDPYSFTVSGDTGGLDNTILGTPDAAVGGSNCTEDYVVIPHPAQNMMDLDYDRFCGNGFIPTTTSSKPFVLTVVTNENEIQPGGSFDNENRGFCLNYRQLPCQ